MNITERLAQYGDQVDAEAVLTSVVLAVLPALGLLSIVSLAADDVIGWVFWLGLVGFTALLAPKDGWRPRIGASLSYLAVEAFLFPIAALIVAIGIASEATATFGQLGAGFAGAIYFVLTWLVSWSVGVVLYYVAGRFEE